MLTKTQFLSAHNTAPAEDYAAITPSDSTDFPGGVCRAIWVGADGNFVAVKADDATTVTFNGAKAGTIVPIRCKRINNTGTTASMNLVALFQDDMQIALANSLVRPGFISSATPASILGSAYKGDYDMGQAGLGNTDDIYRTLDTSLAENNVSVWKNQVSGQPDFIQAVKVSMPQIAVANINGYDAINLDTGNSTINMSTANTVSGSGASLVVCMVLKTTSFPISYCRIIGVAKDAGFDGDANGALCPTGNNSGNGLAVYQNFTDLGNGVLGHNTYRIITAILDAVADTMTLRSAKSVLFSGAWTGTLNLNKFLLGNNNLGAASNAAFLTPRVIIGSQAGSFTAGQIDALETYMSTRYGL